MINRRQAKGLPGQRDKKMESLNMQEQSKIIRREGVILERFDKEKEDGVTTGFFVEWRGSEYFIMMHNGETKRIRKLTE